MSVTATPTLTVAGATMTGAGTAAPLLAVDALRLTWGRASVLERPTPATVALTVLDRTAGATFARRTDLIGQPLVLGWSCSDGSRGVNFRGRITDSDAAPVVLAGGQRAWRVTLAASSREVGLANYTVPEGTVFPAETFDARRWRIAALLTGNVSFPGTPGLPMTAGFPGGIVLPARTDLGLQAQAVPAEDLPTYPAAQLDASGKTALELVQQLFDSTSPLPMVYDPGNDRLTFAPRRRFAYTPIGWTASAQLVTDPDHGGRYVAASLSGRHLEGHLLGYAGALAQPLDTRVTRVEVSYLDQTAGYAQRTASATTAAAALEATLGRRVWSVDSIHADAGKAAQLAALYADVATREGALPRLGTLGYATDREPFHNGDHAAVLLAGFESGGTLFLSGSWLPDLGQRPLIGVCGGVIGYRGGQWHLDLTPTPVTVDPEGFTWAPATIASSSPSVRLRDVDPSVTFGDLAFIDVGPGYTTTTGLPYKGNPL